LGLAQNTFFGELPLSMASMTNLAILAIDDNALTGTLDVLQNLASLQAVYLERNAFTGTIDESFLESADQLTQLDASDNLFIGEVPVHLLGLPTLRILDFNGNELTLFPDNIPGTANFLRLLALHDNPFTGRVPSSIGNLQALTHLDLTLTTFSGSMPEFIGTSLTNLSYLFLAYTEFDPGPIPDSFRQLTNLVDLSLKESSRTGPIPNWISDLDSLILLDLHANDLSGTLPPSLGDMTNLEFPLVNWNGLSGTIPLELPQATSLRKSKSIHAAATENYY
jgi:Leucine-rich repeat (LRR) protein